MKKSELKAIIKECIGEINEASGYVKSEITGAVKKHGNSESKMTLKIQGSNGAGTKFLSITPEEAMKIIPIIKSDI